MRRIKNYILKRFGILKLRDDYWNAKTEIDQLKQTNQYLINEKREIEHRLYDLEKIIENHCSGINTESYEIRKPRIIVSLTSFPARINYVSKVIQRMLIQTVKPDEIILWLSIEQFPQKENELPVSILELKKYGVKIEWCKGDMKAYKKFLPVFKQYPDDLVIILDDDLIYHTDIVERLYRAHLQFPNAIIASRCHEIGMNEQGKISPYSTWRKECDNDTYKPKYDWFLTGGAGTLFPPHIFGPEMHEEEVIRELCPWADDIWLNINAAINRVPIVNVAGNNVLRRIEGTQEVRLEDINIEQNDIQLKNVVMYYKEKLIGTIYENM